MRTSRLTDAAALLRAREEADEEATDADYAWGGFDDDPPGAEERFKKACARLWEIRDQLFLMNVHDGVETVQ
jgi:hypothetical protein